MENGIPIADTFSIGIRTIELVREQDSIGESFYFKVNGKPIFMKGANNIPPSHLVSRNTFAEKKHVLDMAIEANMNMIRVWGGGEYETEEFYDYCDEKGLLVWQDMMFACSMYPGNPDFRKNIGQEMEEQVRRMVRHPSLALICGNNENEVAWGNWGWQQQYGWDTPTQQRIWQDYLYTFDTLLPRIVHEANVHQPYLRSSPSSNWGKIENFDRGNMHYWGVWHGGDRFEDYRKYVPRFMSEYGFQSWPLMKDLVPFVHDRYMWLETPGIVERQKSYKGNAPILEEMSRRYEYPSSFDMFTVYSQRLQATALKMAIEAHRAKQPHCMGTLFWQLNDCWVGPSWSVIGGNGKPKLAYYAVKEAYAPTIVTAIPQGDSLAIYAVSDLGHDGRVNLVWSLRNKKSETIQSWTISAQTLSAGSTQLIKVAIPTLLGTHPKQEVFLSLRLRSDTWEVKNDFQFTE